MKIYNRVVIDISTGKTISYESFEYDGLVADCKGPSVSYPKPSYSVASQIVKGLKDPLSGAIKQDIITNPFTNQASDEYKSAVANIRGGYGARGLEGSGIAVRGEQEALQKIVNQAEAQRAGQLIGVLGTASQSPSFPTGTPQQGGGFLGLK